MIRFLNLTLCLFFLPSAFALWPQENNQSITDINKTANLVYVKADSYDWNKDGKADNIVYLDAVNKKVYMALDFNYDYKMDDFYYYENGILIREEIDSNFDNKIDVWVYLTDGCRIRKIERDKDFNGQIDSIKNYGETP